MLITCNMLAQEPKQDSIRNSLDSFLANYEQVKREGGGIGNKFFTQYYNVKYLSPPPANHPLRGLSRTDEEFLFDYLTDKIENADTLFNTKKLCYGFLFRLGKNSKAPDLRRRVVEVLLGPARIPYNIMDIKYVFSAFKRSDYSEKSKQIIFNMVYKEPSEEEINEHIKHDMYFFDKRKSAEKKALRIIEKNKNRKRRERLDLDINKLIDSIRHEQILAIKRVEKVRCPQSCMIKALGWLDICLDLDTIKKLERLKCNIDEEYLYLRAKAGDKEALDSIYGFKKFNYLYFGTEEALFKYLSNNKIDSLVTLLSKKRELYKEIYEENKKYYTKYSEIQDYILNLPSGVRMEENFSDFPNIQGEILCLGYSWMVRFKDELKLDTGYFESKEALFRYLSRNKIDSVANVLDSVSNIIKEIYKNSDYFYTYFKLRSYILNLPEELKMKNLRSIVFIGPGLHGEMIRPAYEWIFNNKGNLKLDTEKWPRIYLVGQEIYPPSGYN